LIVPPQPSAIVPQVAPCVAQSVFVQLAVLHKLLAPQICPAPQPGHTSVPPQPFDIVPHLPVHALTSSGVQAGGVGVPPVVTHEARSNSM
jgi:hypothetical protein